jgi:BirA family transcriptional regulator, biotin operon repressor / biotin---[acetyl-CoA-carboxylase] ligase
VEIAGIEVRRVERCASTNTVLLEDKSGVWPVLLITEHQTAGRGRRGRRWHSERGQGLTFSLAARVRRAPRELAALSLVAGVAATRALRALGVARAALKWPNDLVVDGAKLGGILVETRALGEASKAVIGIGINLRGAEELSARVRRRVASLDQFIVPSAEATVAAIAAELLKSLRAFEARGLEAVRADWESLDAHAGQRLRVRLADGRSITGVAAGLAADGALQLRTRQGVRAVRSGHVISSRPA